MHIHTLDITFDIRYMLSHVFMVFIMQWLEMLLVDILEIKKKLLQDSCNKSCSFLTVVKY